MRFGGCARWRGFLKFLIPASLLADCPAETIGNAAVSVQLNGKRGYRLEAIVADGVTFLSGGGFPTFLLFNEKGAEVSAGAESSFFTEVRPEKVEGGVRVRYAGDGFAASVLYRFKDDRVVITITPETETRWKVRGVTDNGALVCVSSRAPGAQETGFLVRPYRGGELIRLTGAREIMTDIQPQSWDYDATFVALGLENRGMILRAPQFGGVWTAGTGNIRGAYCLHAGVTVDFRPRRDQPGAYTFWDIALCEPQIDLELIPVADATRDGHFTWADIGVEYRRRFIRRNRHLDSQIPGAVMGKIDLSAPYKNPKTFDELSTQIAAIDYAPQIWWLVGAHTAPDFDFIAPPHSPAPHPGHNGPGDYDYFRFKRDALKANARIGLHEIFDDTSPLNPAEWNRVAVRLQEYGETMGTWSCTMPDGTKFSAISKSLRPVLRDGSFLSELKEHFRQWDVRSGDTWHWDVFTSVGGRSDFDARHPTTHGRDYRDRIEILRQIQKTGVYLTHEGLQEGTAEFSSYAWVTKADPALESKFPGGSAVPLLPALFQGTTYYGAPWKPAWGLLMGGNVAYESTSLDQEIIQQAYFGQNTYWSKICDRTVRNIVETPSGWRVDYDQGGSLKVDLAAMSFVLEVDGQIYTAENPPASPSGYTARLVNGRYEIVRPERN